MRAPRPALLALVVALAGCNRRPPAPGPGPIGLEAALARAGQVQAIELPALGPHARPCPSGPAVAVSSKLLTMDSDRTPIGRVPSDLELGFDARDKRDGRGGLWVAPLHLALHGAVPPTHAPEGKNGALDRELARAARTDEPRVVVAADRRTTMRALMEIVHTADVAIESSVAIAAADGARRGCYALHDARSLRPPARLPRRATLVEPPSRPLLGLAVALRSDGLDLTAANGHVAPGCDDVGEGRTIPHEGGRPSAAALATCGKKLHEASPDFTDERSATLAAPEATPLAELAPLLEALATAGFAHVTLALPEARR